MVGMMVSEDKRRYTSPLRNAQTAQSRARIVDAAMHEFVRLGYAKTSMSGVAAAAGVSRETVYHLIGGKVAVLKAVYDVAVVGDHAESPVADRDVYQAMLADPDPASAARTFGRLSADLVGRIGPVLKVLADAAHEPELADLLAQTRAERLAGTRHLLASLSGAETTTDRFAEAVDETYALVSPEVALVLIDQRGWDPTSYGNWLGRKLAGSVEQLKSAT
jgi:AcrR family transcriptional regulator